MPNLTLESGVAVNITATGNVYANAAAAAAGTSAGTADCILLGFYVNSTTGGTLVLKRGGSSGTALNGTITPAIGFHRFPANCPGGLHATIANTIDVTFFIVPGVA